MEQENGLFFKISGLPLPIPEQEVLPINTHDTVVTASDHAATPDDETDIIWSLLGDEPSRPVVFYSWDQFQRTSHVEPKSAYISEAGPLVFDDMIASERKLVSVEKNCLVVSTEMILQALDALGLGRSSRLFTWVEEQTTFRPTVASMRCSGYTPNTINALQASFIEHGNMLRRLRIYVDALYLRPAFSAQISLAHAISTMLSLVERSNMSTFMSRSFLQLQEKFTPHKTLLVQFTKLMMHSQSSANDEDLLSKVFEDIRDHEHSHASLQNVMVTIFRSLSSHWFGFLADWTGIRRGHGIPITKKGPPRGFVRVEMTEWVDDQGQVVQEPDYVFDSSVVPSFMSIEDAEVVFEIGRDFRILEEHCPEHALVRIDDMAIDEPPVLEMPFSWPDVERLQARASAYERELIMAMEQFSNNQTARKTWKETATSAHKDPKDFFKTSTNGFELELLDSWQVPGQDEPSELSNTISRHLSSESSVSEREGFLYSLHSYSVYSSNPLLKVQARLIDQACMDMLFNQHDLQTHIRLQRDFQLFGNGVFLSRLTQALFNTELESAERRRGVAHSGGIVGLRLGGRDTWPPASSELRLALMGILAESYTSTDKSPAKVNHGSRLATDMPGDLSFAVRDMSEEEITQCMDANSIEALDFLRLSYKPPTPLNTVLTPIILYKYDRMFKMLLRLVRMQYVVTTLFFAATRQTRNSLVQRFCLEARHFVSCLCAYSFDTGIASNWRVFESKMDQIARRARVANIGRAEGQTDSMAYVRHLHEDVLDRMMLALFLRKRQQPVLKLLEEIFTIILRFTRLQQQEGQDGSQDSTVDIGDCLASFREKVGVFMTVCRGLSEKRHPGKSTGSKDTAWPDEHTVKDLLLRLDMSEYYTSNR